MVVDEVCIDSNVMILCLFDDLNGLLELFLCVVMCGCGMIVLCDDYMGVEIWWVFVIEDVMGKFILVVVFVEDSMDV